MNMRTGKVEWYSDKRGFGILSSPTADGALDKFYCHVSKIVRSPEKIEQGQRATFEVLESPLRRVGDLPMAVNVTITEPHKVEPSEARS
jgi:cold shock CspA family protein